MMKKLIALSFALLFVISSSLFSGFAAEIKDIKTDANKITAEVALSDKDKIDKDSVSATIDGKPLNIDGVEVKEEAAEYIVLIDTSLSLSNAHFEAEKSAVKALRKSIGKNDKLSLYTFDTKTVKILDGSESAEDADKKISALKASGQDTAFYGAMKELASKAKSSGSGKVIPVVFTDGVETLNKSGRADAVKSIKDSKVAITALYPDVTSEKDVSSLKDFMKECGGKSASFNVKNASDKLSETGKSAGAKTASIVMAATDTIAANDKAVLSIDLGDGKAITKETPVKAWQTETAEITAEATGTETESKAESTTAANTETTTKTSAGLLEEYGDILKIAIPALAALILLIVALIVVKKIRGGKKAKPEESPVTPSVTEEVKPEEPAAVTEEPEDINEPEITEPEVTEEATAEEPEASDEGEISEETPAEAEETEEREKTPEEIEAEEKAKAEAEERARQRAEKLEQLKATAAARAATMAQMGSEAKAAAEAKAARAESDRKAKARAEKEAAAAAKERAKKEKANKKKMKEEGAGFQFYFVDKK